MSGKNTVYAEVRQTANAQNGRLLSLDAVKILAIFAVILIHTCMDFVDFAPQTAAYRFGGALDTLARLGVPLFVMVSGALLLDETRHITLRVLFKKYILSIVLLFALWSFIYAFIGNVLQNILSGEPVDVVAALSAFAQGDFHMWYLYMLVGLYLITPILKAFVNKANAHLVLYFIIAALVFQFTRPLLSLAADTWQGFSYLMALADKLELFFFNGYAAYYLTGWYLFHIGIRKRAARCALYIAGAAALLINLILLWTTGDYVNLYSNMNLLIYLYAAGVFCLIIQAYQNRRHNNRLLQTLATLSFGVYITHLLVLNVLTKLMPATFPYPIALLLKFVIAAAVSYGACYVMSKIPYVKKLIKLS